MADRYTPPTPGERAYEAWLQMLTGGGDDLRRWSDLTPDTRARWETIALAAREA